MRRFELSLFSLHIFFLFFLIFSTIFSLIFSLIFSSIFFLISLIHLSFPARSFFLILTSDIHICACRTLHTISIKQVKRYQKELNLNNRNKFLTAQFLRWPGLVKNNQVAAKDNLR